MIMYVYIIWSVRSLVISSLRVYTTWQGTKSNRNGQSVNKNPHFINDLAISLGIDWDPPYDCTKSD